LRKYECFGSNTLEIFIGYTWAGLTVTQPAIKKLQGGGSMIDEAHSIRQTREGGFIVAGFSNSSNTGILTGLINYGNYDYLILKLDAQGNAF